MLFRFFHFVALMTVKQVMNWGLFFPHVHVTSNILLAKIVFNNGMLCRTQRYCFSIA